MALTGSRRRRQLLTKRRSLATPWLDHLGGMGILGFYVQKERGPLSNLVKIGI